MQKNIFHNIIKSYENKVVKKSDQILKIGTKSIVDINILLNRIKIDKKNEKKRKIFFFSFLILVLSLLGTFITIIK